MLPEISPLHTKGILNNLGPIPVVDRKVPTRVVTKAEQVPQLLEQPPRFEGQLLTNADELARVADDYGHLVHNRPLAVLLPASEQDVVEMVRYAAARRIPIAARGQGHSSFGQSQVQNGIVIDMSSLSSIQSINRTEIEVDAGITWLDLLRTSVAQGLTPPIVPDYLSLTIGGVLSAGGLGSQSPFYGAAIDNVLELEVVTGKGDLIRCTPRIRVDLFDAVRGGLGQFGIITKARLRLIPAPRTTRLYQLGYDDLSEFLTDMETLLDDQRFDTLQGFVFPKEEGGWRFQLEANKYVKGDIVPNEGALLSGLSFVPKSVSMVEQPYFTGDATSPGYLDRVEALVPFLCANGQWNAPHPWLNLFVPSHTAYDTIGQWLESTSLDDTGQGIISIYPYNRNPFSAPFLRLPDTMHFFLFALLRNSTPASNEQNEKLLRLNRKLFEEAQAIGGMRYPIDSVPMSDEDWQAHFGPTWELFTMFKQLHDPDRLLAPGQGIFPQGDRFATPTQSIFQHSGNEFVRH